MSEVADLTVEAKHNEVKNRIDAIVKFDDPVAMKKIFSKIPNVHCIYTIEITPKIESVPTLKLFLTVTHKLRLFVNRDPFTPSGTRCQWMQ